MARNSLGSLIVSLGLDAAQYVAGLTKAEFEAKKFQQSLEKGVAAAGRNAAAAMALLATGAVAAGVAIDRLAKGAANFKDLEEKTGASAEGLASMAVAAAVAGTEMNTVASASVKLTKNLTGVDDESTAAGAALKTLGINIKEFKQLDPAAQMETVAKALAGFADGAGKTAVAVALLGKSGADMLPFLKELAGESGRQVILTQRQIEQADAYADAQARLTAQIRLYAQSLAADVIPLATDFIAKLVESRRQATNLFEAMKSFTSLGVFSTAEEDVVRLVGEINHLEQKIAAIKARGPVTIFGFETGIGKTDNLEANLAKLRKAFDAAQAVIAARNATANALPENRPTLKFEGAADKAKKAAKEQQADADRYIDSLDKQIEKTKDLTVEQQALQDIQAGRIKDITAMQIVMVLGMAREVDAAIALKKATDDAARAEEERARARAQLFEQMTRETDALLQTNQQIEDEIALLGKDAAAHDALAKKRIDDDIALKKWLLDLAEANRFGQEYIQGLKDQIEVLERRKVLLDTRAAREQMLKDAQAIAEINQIFTDSFADGLASVATGTKSVSDAFRDMERQIISSLARIAAQNIAKSIFGGGDIGTDNLIGKVIGLALGAAAGGGYTGGFSGGGFGEHFASGGTSRGGMALVGERGPEVINLPRGAQVIPMDKWQGGKSTVINAPISVTIQGTATSQTAMQFGVEAQRALARASRRNG